MKKHKPYGSYEKYIKRPLDCILSGVALVLLSPILGIIAILVRCKLGSPVLFTQNRPGMNEEIFKLYKFRSMTDDRDKIGNLLPDYKRSTKFGKILRSTSLDELPELINIFKGDMAIVGPRPLLPEYLPYYDENEKHRHDVRPGLTGEAQINGRSFLTWEQIFQYDLDYVNNVSFSNDCNIIVKTVLKVLNREDIADTSNSSSETLDKRVHKPLNVERGQK